MLPITRTCSPEASLGQRQKPKEDRCLLCLPSGVIEKLLSHEM